MDDLTGSGVMSAEFCLALPIVIYFLVLWMAVQARKTMEDVHRRGQYHRIAILCFCFSGMELVNFIIYGLSSFQYYPWMSITLVLAPGSGLLGIGLYYLYQYFLLGRTIKADEKDKAVKEGRR